MSQDFFLGKCIYNKIDFLHGKPDLNLQFRHDVSHRIRQPDLSFRYCSRYLSLARPRTSVVYMYLLVGAFLGADPLHR